MSQENYAIGVDIGTSKVRAILGYMEDESISLLEYEEAEYDSEYEAMAHGKIVNTENTIRTVNKVLKKLADKFGEPITHINTNICQTEISSSLKKEEYTQNGKKFTINNGILENFVAECKEDFKNNIRDKELLHSLPTDFYLDEVKLSKKPSGTTGNKLGCNFKYIHAKPKTLDDYYYSLKEIKAQGIKREESITISGLVYSPLTDIYSLLTDADKKEGIITINIGAGMVKVSAFLDNAPRFLSVIPFGGDNITQDIEKVYGLNQKEAEMLKKACMFRNSNEIEINEIMTLLNKDGLPPKKFLEKNVAEIAEWRLKEIIAIVHNKLTDAGISEVPHRGIILAGEMAKVPAVNKIIRQQFDTDAIRIGVSTKNIHANGHLELAHPKYSSAIGLVLAQLVPFDSRVKTISVEGVSKQSRSNGIGKKLWNKWLGGDNLDQRYVD